MKHRWLFAFGLAAASALAAEPTPAFPGAEGAGRLTTGGRGGAVVHVTNLLPDGPGSLAEAVSQSNRIVVFDVSGIIDLSRTKGDKKESKKSGATISVEQPNITIAGQTAPGEGICLKGGTLHIAADNVIVRYLRSRRGFNRVGDMGDAFEVKPPSTGVRTNLDGQSQEHFDKVKIKKEQRGKYIHSFALLTNVVIDHCSASWATDENLTATHTDHTTVSWCIAAEGCDYANPNQTPPNHSEGSLWGSEAPDGRATLHHTLYANNRLRNPRTTGGAETPAVLNGYNCVVYNWSEYPSHTGSQRVFVNWLNNYYQAGPDTPTDLRFHMFEFHGDPGARLFARGNFIAGSPAATANNKLAIFHNEKFKKMSAAEKEAMKVDAPFADLPATAETALAAYESVLAEAGATLPSRDAVDCRIVRGVRSGTGRIIGKEIDLPADQRWPEYRPLPLPADADHDGLPDFWEQQFGLNPHDPSDSARLAGGYANVEHYFNNTDPTGGRTPIVFAHATTSRAHAKNGEPGIIRLERTGDLSAALTVSLVIGGDAQAGKDFESLPASASIPAGKKFVDLIVKPLATTHPSRLVTVAPATGQTAYHVGCPAQSLVVIE